MTSIIFVDAYIDLESRLRARCLVRKKFRELTCARPVDSRKGLRGFAHRNFPDDKHTKLRRRMLWKPFNVSDRTGDV